MLKKKTIWFVNKDAAPVEYYGAHLRTVKLAQFFQNEGYHVKLFCSSFIHNRNICLSDSKEIFEEKIYDGIPFVLVNTGGSSINGIKRIVSYFKFATKLLFFEKKFDKPDIIVHTSRIPFDFPVYLFAKKLKAKYIVDATDLWPEAFVRFGLMNENNPLLKLFYWMERAIYSKADHVVFSMPGAVDYLKSKKWDREQGGSIDLIKVHYINNGVDLVTFTANLQKYRIDDDDLSDENTFKVIYLGSIRLVNNLKQLIDAAQILQNNNVRILIYGDGDDRDFLEQYCKDQNIINVKFKAKWTSPEYVPYILSKAGIHALNYAANLGKYGGSMNKMFMGLASGKPLCCNTGMSYSIIREEEVGIDRRMVSSQDYADAIRTFINMPSLEYQKMCDKARTVAEKYDYAKLCVEFKNVCDL